MKKLLFAGVASALALSGLQARADDGAMQQDQGSFGSESEGSYGSDTGSTGSTGSTGKTGTMGQAGTTDQMGSESMMMGRVTNVDKKKNMVTLEVPISPTAQVMRDGKTVSLDQIKKGDDVRASFDPSTYTITEIEVSPKGSEKMDKSQKSPMTR